MAGHPEWPTKLILHVEELASGRMYRFERPFLIEPAAKGQADANEAA
jgi:hypothetical protein